ncbi:MAG: gamma-glutamylcyclotransferase family protein [Patescibacteria group bacterium]
MKLFAYGALMSQTWMKHIGVDPSTRQAAFLPKYSLVFTKQAASHPQKGFATIISDNNKTGIHGILYELTDEDVKIIDKTEDYPIGYTREEVFVTLSSGDKVEATTYVATPFTLQENLLPTKEYIALITESKDLLPADYITKLMQTVTLD